MYRYLIETPFAIELGLGTKNGVKDLVSIYMQEVSQSHCRRLIGEGGSSGESVDMDRDVEYFNGKDDCVLLGEGNLLPHLRTNSYGISDGWRLIIENSGSGFRLKPQKKKPPMWKYVDSSNHIS